MSPVPNLTFSDARLEDAQVLAALRTTVADHLTSEFGRGHWSSVVSETGVLRDLKTSKVIVARQGSRIIGTLRFATRKPWAIDPAFFTQVPRPLYLTDMAVLPTLQRQGVGERLLAHAEEAARVWPGDAIRLDAYAGPAGAGPFYARCGYREVAQVTYRRVRLVYYERLL